MFCDVLRCSAMVLNGPKSQENALFQRILWQGLYGHLPLNLIRDTFVLRSIYTCAVYAAISKRYGTTPPDPKIAYYPPPLPTNINPLVVEHNSKGNVGPFSYQRFICN